MTDDRETPTGHEGTRTAAARARVVPGWLPPAAGFAAALAVRLWRLDASCLWFDELFGLHAARHAWAELPRFVALDLVHPPLFYVLLKVWVGLGGESVWWLRLLPAVVSSLAAVPLWLLARELRLPARAAALALALAAVSGFLVKYAQEVRMYAPLVLLAACSLWLFARFCRARDADADAHAAGDDAAERDGGDDAAARDDGGPSVALRERRGRPVALAALTAANLLLVYTHYFGWLLVALELAFVVVWARGRFKSLAASTLLVAVCFAPWAWAVWRAAGAAGGGLQQNIGWASRPAARELLLPYLLLHEPFRFQRHSAEPIVLRLTVLMSLALFAPALAALAVRELKRAYGGRELEPVPDGRDEGAETRPRASFEPAGESFALRFLVFFSAAPVAAAFVLSWLLPQSVWGTRHLVVVAPAYLLLVAHAVTSLRPRWLAAGVQLLAGCWLLLALAGTFARRPATLVWCSWETLAARLAREAGGREAATVYAAEELAAYHLWHALVREGDGGGAKFRVAVVRNVPGVVEDRAFFLPRGFDEIRVEEAGAALGGDDFWIAFRAPAADTDHPLLRSLAARGYATGPRFEATAQGQRVTLVRVTRR